MQKIFKSLLFLALVLANAATVPLKLAHSSNKLVILPYIYRNFLWIANGNELIALDDNKEVRRVKFEKDIVCFEASQEKLLVGLEDGTVWEVLDTDAKAEKFAEKLVTLAKPAFRMSFYDGVLYVMSAERDLYCLKDGILMWKVVGVPAQRLTRMDFIIEENYLLAAIKPSVLTVTNRLSGLQVYEYVFAHNTWVKFVLTGKGDGQEICCLSDAGVLVLDAKTSKKKSSANWNMSGCVVSDDRVYLYNSTGVYIYNAGQLKDMWSTDEKTGALLEVHRSHKSLFLECKKGCYIFSFEDKKLEVTSASSINIWQGKDTRINMTKAGRALIKLEITGISS